MKLFAVLGLMALGSSAATADEYAPGPKVPDYFASVTEDVLDNSNPIEIRHHGEWTRIDRAGGVLYLKTRGAVTARLLQTSADTTPYYVTITYYPQKANGSAIPRDRPTGETDTFLGEKCYRWWLRDLPPPSRKSWSHCLTLDGVELAAQITFDKNGHEELFEESRATVVERRKIDPKEVEPAASHLDLRRRLEVPEIVRRSAKRPPDVIVTMETAGGVSTLKRRYPWFSWDTRKADGNRQLHVWNQKTGQGAEISLDPKLRNHIGFSRGFSVNGFKDIAGAEGRLPLGLLATGRNLGKTEVVLGVTCDWFDTTPGDKYRTSEICFSKDGVPLGIKQSRYGSDHQTFLTKSLRYRDISADEMLPEADLLKPAGWGFPEQP